MKFRLLGILFLLGGLAAGWFLGLEPIRQAEAHAEIVKYDMRTFMIVPLALFIGLLLIVGGEKVWGIVHGTPQNARDWTYRIGLVAVTAGVAWLSWSWFSAHMTALGYVAAS